MMNKTLLPILAVVVLTVTSALAAPKLAIPVSDFDFGYAPQNSSISRVFWLKSQGDDTLKILKVIPGCGCTQAPLQKEVVPPGDSTQLEIIFHTRTYSGISKKSPTIQTNEGPPDSHVSFTANVMPRPDSTYPVIIAPYKLDLSQFTEKAREKMTFTINNVSDKKLTPSMVYCPNEFFTIKLPGAINAGGKAEGTLILTSKGIAESFEKSFTIALDDEKSSRFTVPVKRTIQSSETNVTSTAVGH